jgi:uncharacterized protein (TIGR02118 family)
MAALVFVAYPAGDGTHFDRDYYVETHLPLAERGWGEAGLQSARAFFPPDDSPYLAVAVLTFVDEDAIAAALALPATTGIMGDLPNFTNASPLVLRSAAL